jgi:F-type H+-transporting ATPase subunit b
MEIDPTLILLQLIPFLVVLVGLYFIILKPMLKVIEEREKNIVLDRRDAEDLEQEVNSKLAELDEKLARARSEANTERQKLREEIRQRDEALLDRARIEADVMVGEARVQIAAERRAASKVLRDESETLAKEIASSVLGREV